MPRRDSCRRYQGGVVIQDALEGLLIVGAVIFGLLYFFNDWGAHDGSVSWGSCREKIKLDSGTVKKYFNSFICQPKFLGGGVTECVHIVRDGDSCSKAIYYEK